jgi:hypothetical protein
LLLDCLVSSFILGEVGEWDFGLQLDSGAVDHSLTDGSAELAKYIVARVHYKGQISLSTFGAKDQVFTLLSDHPVKQRNDILHEGYVLSLPLSVRTGNLVFWLLGDPILSVGVLEARLLLLLVLGIGCEVVDPGEFECSDQEVNAPLESLDACQFRDGALIVEMLDPALELFNSLSEHGGLDALGTVPGLFPLIEIANQRR